MKKFLILTVVTTFTVLTSLQTKAASYSDFTLGNSQAPLKIEIFHDFQCPYCAKFHRTISSPTIQKFVRSGKLHMTFKDFPLDFHINAKTAARAANAVLSLDSKKYQSYMNFLYRTQNRWSSMEGAARYFADQAVKMGINPESFKTAFDDPENQQEIERDITEGYNKNVNGTPTYFLNGEEHAGSQPLRTLLEQIKAAQ